MKRLAFISLLVASVLPATWISAAATLADTHFTVSAESTAEHKPQAIIGLVVDMVGNWHIENGTERKSLSNGEDVYEGWRLKRDSAQGSIKLALVNKVRIECPGQLHVGDVLTLTKWKHPKNDWWSTFLPLVSQHGGWVWSGCREVDGIYLCDGVVNGEKNSLDLSCVMAQLPDGNYSAKISEPGDRVSSPIALTLLKSRDTTKASSVPAIQPGVYQISVTPRQGVRLPHALDDSFILVTTASRFDSLSALFKRAIEETAYLGALSPGNGRADMLRCYLLALGKNLPETTLSRLR